MVDGEVVEAGDDRVLVEMTVDFREAVEGKLDSIFVEVFALGADFSMLDVKLSTFVVELSAFGLELAALGVEISTLGADCGGEAVEGMLEDIFVEASALGADVLTLGVEVSALGVELFTLGVGCVGDLETVVAVPLTIWYSVEYSANCPTASPPQQLTPPGVPAGYSQQNVLLVPHELTARPYENVANGRDKWISLQSKVSTRPLHVPPSSDPRHMLAHRADS